MRKELIIKQEEISDCGVCSLLSIIRYYKGNIPLEELRISSLTNKYGVSAQNLIDCAIQYGFDAQGIKLDNITNEHLPCIAHIKVNDALYHFVVLYKIVEDDIIIMDPAIGEKRIKLNDFYKSSTNIYILLKPKCVLQNLTNPNSIENLLNNEIHKRIPKLLKIIIFNFIFLLSSIVQSFYISILLKTYNLNLLLIFLFNIILSNICLFLIRNNINKLNIDISNNLVSKFFNHIFRLPLKYIHIKDSNEIIKRVLDLDSIKELLLSFIINLITNIIIILVVSSLISYINLYLLLFILITIIGYLLIVIILNMNISNNIDTIIEKDTEYNNSLIDYISGLISIKHTSSEKYFSNKLYNKYKDNNDTKYIYNKYILFIDLLKQGFIALMEFILNVFIIRLILDNKLNINDLIIINFLFKLIIDSLATIGDHIPGLLYQRKIITKVNEFYQIREESNKKEKLSFNNIKFNNVSFSYNNYKNVVNNINVIINKNDKLIIKGASGSGKSTLCKLINKEYDNYKGNIYLGNINYKELSIKSIRNLISYSSQDEILFHGTIRDNILMGNKVSQKKLDTIIDICCLNRIINKKTYGLDTYLFGGGSELSGGERQLIILARSLVLDKPILILDETLSEVNDKVEDKILNNLFNKYKNKMIIYVSHKNKKNYFHRTLYV